MNKFKWAKIHLLKEKNFKFASKAKSNTEYSTVQSTLLLWYFCDAISQKSCEMKKAK